MYTFACRVPGTPVLRGASCSEVVTQALEPVQLFPCKGGSRPVSRVTRWAAALLAMSLRALGSQWRMDAVLLLVAGGEDAVEPG